MTQTDPDASGSGGRDSAGPDSAAVPALAELPLVRSRSIGSLTVHAIEAGRIRLDGGAMFGVVPRPLWEKRIPPDEKNRIPMALRCLLVEAPSALVLIDTGVGNKETEKSRRIHGIENEGSPTRLEDGIRAAGFDPGDVDIVLNTHLHFDHAGGNTRLPEQPDRTPGAEPSAGDPARRPERPVPSFPGARYVVQEGELDFSRSDNERIRASYRLHDVDPVDDAGLWHPIRGESVVAEGITVLPTPGHTPHHHSVLLDGGSERACFLADVCPTSAHLRLAWIMGYDLEPLVTLESKRKLWRRAKDEDWLLVFQHDPVVPWGRLDPDVPDPQLLHEPPKSEDP